MTCLMFAVSEGVQVAIIGLIGSFITSCFALVTLIVTRRTAEKVSKTERAIEETKELVLTVEKQGNSMKDALVKLTGEAEFAKGLKQGQSDVAKTEGT